MGQGGERTRDRGRRRRSSLPALLDAAGLVVPGDLRERTLDALGDVAAERLLAAPGQRDIGAALARAGADALVYLLLADDEADGVRANGAGERPRANGGQTAGAAGTADPRPAAGTPLQRLRGGARARAARGRRSTRTRTNRARERLAAALGQACTWAGEAVVSPLLKAVPAGLPRLVIVPTGSLSLVPWHAARCADDDGGWTYACARAVFTYAASGRQFAEVTQRPKLPPGQNPVIVADPTSSLDGAEGGGAGDPARQLLPAGPLPRAGDRRGRPGRARRGARGPAVRDQRGRFRAARGLRTATWKRAVPTGPFLNLADGRPLTVGAILRQAAGRDPAAAGGLVCLAACRTDLAAEDYDEALTLATAFLAGGAVGVVGARWEIPDLQSSALMFMFHYFLMKRDLPESEALRQAQLWMLDPDARDPGRRGDAASRSPRWPGSSGVRQRSTVVGGHHPSRPVTGRGPRRRPGAAGHGAAGASRCSSSSRRTAGRTG